MRVGFDVQVLRRTKGGTAVYVQNLLEALRKGYPDAEFIPLDSALRIPRRNFVTKLGNAVAELYYLHVLLPSQARRAQVDLVHFPANMVSLRLHCPSVVTIHDMMTHYVPEAYDPVFLAYYKIFVPISARRATRIITVSEFSKQDIVRHCRVPADKVVVTPNGVAPGFKAQDKETARALLAEHYGIDSRPIVLFAGELNPRKNIVNLVRAFGQIRRSKPEHACQLVLVGENRDPAYQQQIRSTIEHERVLADVKLVGYVPNEHLTSFYAASNVLAYVSLYEGFGLPAVEAMASGLPVVTSNLSSLPGVVGDAGLLADPYSIASIAEGLEAALWDHPLRGRMIAAGYERAKAFRWENTATATIGVYEQALEVGSRRSEVSRRAASNI